MNSNSIRAVPQSPIPVLRAPLGGAAFIMRPTGDHHELALEFYTAEDGAVPKVRHTGPGVLTPESALRFAQAVGREAPGAEMGAMEFALLAMSRVAASRAEAAEDAAGVPDAPPDKVVTLRAILANPDALAPPPVQIPRFVHRGRVTVYSALDKAGKSTLMTAAVAAYTTGRDFLGEPCGPGTVLWLLLEEHVGDFARRAVRFGADPDRLHVMSYTNDAEKDLREAMAHIRPDVVVVDTLIRYAGDRVRDGNQSAQWNPVLTGLVQVAREFDAGVAVLSHARKSDGRSRDSGDITASADRVLEQPERPVGGKQAFKVRSRYEQEDFTVVLVGDEYRLDVAGDAPSEVRVMEFLRANPGAGTSAIRRGVTGATGVIDTAVAELLRRGLVVDQGSGNRHRYRLAAGAPDPESVNHPSQGWSQGDSGSTLTPITPVSQGGVRVESGSESGPTLTPPQTRRVGESGQADAAGDLFPPPTLTPAEIAALPVEPDW